MFRSLSDLYIIKIQTRKTSQDQINLAIAVGQLIASIGTNRRVSDGNQCQVHYKTKNKRGYYAKDPTNPNQNAVTPQWGGLKPFVLKSPFGITAQDRLKYLSSKQFHEHYKRVEQFGKIDSKIRKRDQTEIAIFWGYDGAERIGVPPRLYNQVAEVIARKKKNTFAQNAQLFAAVNYAMADTGIAAWETKYYYDFPRPITVIRSGTPSIKADPKWTPLGSQPGNGKPSFTPGFPSCVSGHACFGSALFQVLRRFYRTDKISFTLTSDEFNGKTIDSRTRKPRPKRTRSYNSFKEARHENSFFRIYLGVHWLFDENDGEILGEKVANYVCDRML